MRHSEVRIDTVDVAGELAVFRSHGGVEAEDVDHFVDVGDVGAIGLDQSLQVLQGFRSIGDSIASD